MSLKNTFFRYLAPILLISILTTLTGCPEIVSESACGLGHGLTKNYSIEFFDQTGKNNTTFKINPHYLVGNNLTPCNEGYCQFPEIIQKNQRQSAFFSNCTLGGQINIDTVSLDIIFKNTTNVTFSGWDQQDFPQTNIRQYGIAYLRSNETGIHTSLDPNNAYHQLDMSVTVNNVDDIVITIDSTSVTMAQYLVENPQ